MSKAMLILAAAMLATLVLLTAELLAGSFLQTHLPQSTAYEVDDIMLAATTALCTLLGIEAIMFFIASVVHVAFGGA